MKQFFTIGILLFFYLQLNSQTNTSPLPAGETIIGGHLHAGASNEVWTDAGSLYFNYRGNATTTHFWDRNGSSGKSIMTLLSNGNVGIGVEPDYKLHSVAYNNTGTASAFLWGQYYGTAIGIQTADPKYYAFNVISGIATNGSGGKSLFIVNGDGNVGIGTASPAKKLSIFGNTESGANCGIRLDNNALTWDIENSSSSDLDFSIGGSVRFSLGRENEVYVGSKSFLMFPSDSPGGQDMLWIDMANTSLPEYQIITLKNHSGKTIFDIQQNGIMHVAGTVMTSAVEVKPDAWADDVFSSDYKLLSLSELKEYIKVNSHLPGIPSEKEVKDKGIDLGEMNATLLRKVEELSLYIIQQNNEITLLKKELEGVKTQIKK
jgi:hypothetical protein